MSAAVTLSLDVIKRTSRFCKAVHAPGLIGTQIAAFSISDCNISKQVGAFIPRYFFDIDDGLRRARDKWGKELPDVNHVMKEVNNLIRTLSDIRDIEKRSGTTFVKVRLGEDEQVIEVSTSLNI